MNQNTRDDALAEVLARRVRQLRDQRGWSTRQAAAQAGITQSKWVRLESGRGDPTVGTVTRVQRAFGLATIEAVFGDLPSTRLRP